MGLTSTIRRLVSQKGSLPAPDRPDRHGLDSSLVTRQEDIVGDFRDVARFRFLAEYAKDMALDLALFNATTLATSPLRLYTSKPRVLKGAEVRRVDPGRRPHLWSQRKVGAKAVQRAERSGEVFEIVDHDLLDLMARPDPSTTGLAWNVLRFVNKQLFGDALLLVVPGSQRPIAGLPQLQPQWADVQPDKDDRIAGWYYGRDYTDRRQYEARDVFQMKWADNPHTIYRGLGWLELAIRELEIEDQALAAELARWKNGGYPEGVLAFKNVKTKEQLDEAVDAFHAALKRSRRKGGVIATSEAAYSPLSVAKEMNYIPGLELIERRLLNRAGIPQTIYFMNDANRASSISAESTYAKNTLNPALVIDAEQWTEFLIPIFGGDTATLWFAYDPVGEADEEGILADIAGTVPFAVRTPNEARALLGLPPSKDPRADQLLFNGVTLEALEEQATAAANAGGFGEFVLPLDGTGPSEPADGDTGETEIAGELPPAEEALNGAQIKELVNLALQAAQGLIPKESAIAMALAAFPGVSEEKIRAIFDPIVEGAAPDEEETEAEPETVAAVKAALFPEFEETDVYSWAHDHQTKAGEPDPEDPEERAGRAEFRKLVALMLAWFDDAGKKAKSDVAAGDDPNLASLDPALTRGLEPIVGSIMERGAKRGYEIIGRSDEDFFENAPEAALAAVRERTSLVVEQIRGTTEDGIRRSVERGLEAGMTTRQVADLVVEAVDNAGPARAETIARTESANAYSAGSFAAWGEAGMTSKRWLLAPDACSICQRVVDEIGHARPRESKGIPMGDPFWPAGKTIVGADGRKFTPRLPVLYPPVHPNDRCDFIPELED